MRTALCLTVAAALLLGWCRAQPVAVNGYNNFQRYSIEEGLPQSNVYCIMQDSRGYLWLGTDGGGASRFDGVNFLTYNKKKGLAGNVVRCITEDSKGNLWFGTDEGITFYNGLEFKTINENDSLKGSTILDIFEDSRHNIWVATDDAGISKMNWYNKDSVIIENISRDQGLSSPTAFDIHEDKAGRLWVATLYGGVSILTFIEDTFDIAILKGVGDIPSDMLLTIEEDQDGNLWFGTYDKGVFEIKPTGNNESWEVITFRGLNSGSVWDISSCSNGEIWFGTGENGAKRLLPGESGADSAHFVTYTIAQGLAGNQILSIFEDSEENIWLGTNGDGLCKFVGDLFSHYSEAEGLSNNKVQGIEQDPSGNYWLVSDGGGLSFLTFEYGNPVFSNYTTDEGMPTDFGTSLSLGHYFTNKNIWISTIKNGIVKFDGRSFTNLTEADDLYENRVNDIFVDSRGIVWCGTARGISRWSGSTFVNVSMAKMIISDEGVKSIIEDNNGTLWFGSAGALIKYPRNDSVTTYDEMEGLYDKDVNAIVLGPKENIWIGTNGGGLYKFDTRTKNSKPISFIANDSLLSSNTINSLVFQDENNLIIGTDKGFDKITFNKAQHIVRVRNYNATDGFIGMECNDNAICRDAEGNIWFGTVKGITRYMPSAEKANEQPPIVQITDIKLFFKEVDWSAKADTITPWFNLPQALALPHSENHLTFYFSAISLSNPHKVKFSYMLEGQDVNWSPPSNENKVFYSGLGFGTYTFKVKAMNANGVWNTKPTVFTFIINPPWYRTIWFYILCMIVAVTLIVLYIKWRERKLKREKKILEDTVVERTREVVRQKEEIEEKNKEITDSINYASRIQEAILPLHVEIENMLPESFILFKPKDIVSGDFYWITERDGKVLFTAADCTGHGVPGAFMSMIGTSLLNEVVNKNGITKPSEILFEVRRGIINALKQTGEEGQQKDGMDMALCTWNKSANTVEYAGANNSLYIVRRNGNPLIKENGEELEPNIEEGSNKLFEIKASKMPVGYYTGEETPFINHELKLEKEDTIYAFSDGFPDQFGGPNGKKFKSKSFKKLILSIQDKPMPEQKEVLNNTIIEWMGSIEQIDDICVMGVKV